jgi:hypothetical protein
VKDAHGREVAAKNAECCSDEHKYEGKRQSHAPIIRDALRIGHSGAAGGAAPDPNVNNGAKGALIEYVRVYALDRCTDYAYDGVNRLVDARKTDDAGDCDLERSMSASQVEHWHYTYDGTSSLTQDRPRRRDQGQRTQRGLLERVGHAGQRLRHAARRRGRLRLRRRRQSHSRAGPL